MVTRVDYDQLITEAARAVLLEVINVLGEYRDGIALVGGWVPSLLFGSADEQHVGSMDVDLALDHRLLAEPGYETIRNRLLSRGYKPHDEQPFIFFRTFEIQGREVTVELDLLAGEYGGTGRGRRTQRIQDARARKARGCDLVFEMNEEVRLTGSRPDGRKDTATLRIASVVPFLVMKGMALLDRDNEKDAYDIAFCLRNFPGGVHALADVIRPHVRNALVREGFSNIAGKFASPEHVGPVAVADFQGGGDWDERELVQRDVYERVKALIEGVGLTMPAG